MDELCEFTEVDLAVDVVCVEWTYLCDLIVAFTATLIKALQLLLTNRFLNQTEFFIELLQEIVESLHCFSQLTLVLTNIFEGMLSFLNKFFDFCQRENCGFPHFPDQ